MSTVDLTCKEHERSSSEKRKLLVDFRIEAILTGVKWTLKGREARWENEAPLV